MYKKMFLLGILYSLSIKSVDWQVDTRFSAGPAWHKFFSYQTFNLSVREFVEMRSPLEVITSQFDMMAYCVGTIRGHVGPANLQVSGSGGSFHNDIASVANFRQFDFPIAVVRLGDNVSNISASVKTADVQLGVELALGCSDILINPLIGFVYNQEKVHLNVIGIDRKYDYNNIWQGPYIGAELFTYPVKKLLVKPFYKCVIGKLKSFMRFTPSVVLGEGSRAPADTPTSYRKVAALGNIFGTEVSYALGDCWNLGGVLTYEMYSNRKKSAVRTGPCRTDTLTNATLEKMIWKQVIGSFFVEYLF